GHVAPYKIFPAPVTCGAVVLIGSFMRVHRVRVVNFCVQAPPECFPIALFASSSQPASFNIVEDCIVEKPSENNTHETTLLCSVGDAYANSRSCIVRNNFHSAAFANGWITRPIAVSAVSTVGGSGSPPLAELTTSQPHTHISGKAIVVQGVKVAGNLSAVYNGVYFIETIVSGTVLRYRLEASPETGSIDVSAASIGGSLSSEFVAIDHLTYSADKTPADIYTKVPHRRTRGENVLLNNVSSDATGLKRSAFWDTFPIAQIISSTCFRILMPFGAPADPSMLYLLVNGISASVGPDFFGRGALHGTGCVTEGNAVFDCPSGCYQDTGSTRDVVLRDNYYSNIGLGVVMNFAPDSFDAFRGPSAIIPVAVGGEKRGLFTTIQPHGLSITVPATKVTIREAGSATPDAN